MSLPDNSPTPPKIIYGETIRLRFSHIFPGNAALGHAPGYHFRILEHRGKDAGHISFRVGETPHILQVAGHIGYEVIPQLRGNGYAEQACRAIAPFISTFYNKVIITANPDNAVSLHIIEKLDAQFLNEIVVPKDDSAYKTGARLKRRYRWIVRH